MSARYTGGLVYNAPGGWSGYFDGSGDYIQVTSAAALQFGTGNFTIELWLNLAGQDTNGAAIFNNYNSFTTGALGFFAGHTSASTTKYEVAVNGTFPAIQSSTSVTYNTWNHFAIVRNGNTLTLYINGVADGTYSVSGITLNGVGSYWWLGSAQDAPSTYETKGYISNFRVVKGTAVYTANFTPPTAALLPITNTSLLTCAYSTFRDGSSNAFSLTVTGNTAVSNVNPFPTSVLPNPALGNAGNGVYTMSQYAALKAANLWPAYDPYYENVTLNLHGNAGAVLPFNTDASTNNFQVTQVGDTRPSNYTPFIENGYWSNLFNGSSGVTVSSTSSQFGFSGDFTWEAWINPSSLPSSGGNYSIICSRGSVASNSAFQFLFGNSSGTYQITGTISISSSDSNLTWNIATAPSVGTWYHVAIVRSGSSVQAYWNGTAIGSAQTASGTTNTPTVNPSIGFRGGAYNDLFFNGYISNFRMVGSAVYTSNFTPSTTPLTAISGTRILTCQSNRFVDNSTNAFTLAAYSAPSVNPLQPFTAPTGTSAYGSGYFDGSGDYLSVLDNTALEFGSGDFTVEMWAYYSSTSGTPVLIDKRANTGGYSPFIFYTTGGVVVFYSSSNGSSYDIANGVTIGTIIPNQWNHVAASRSGTSIRLFLNGVLGNTVTSSSALVNNSDAWTLGATPGGNSYNGYLSNARLVKGTAVYTSAFTPPTTPLTAITNTSLLTVQTNAPSQNNTFLDSSTNNFVITRNGNTTQGTFTPYGSNWSNYFDGSGDYLQVSHNTALDLGSGDFTVEFWLNAPSWSSGTAGLVGKKLSDSTNGWQIYRDSGQPTKLNGRLGQQNNFFTTSSVTTNVWEHWALVRTGTTLYWFKNGVLDATGSSSLNIADATASLNVAFGDTWSAYANCYLSNLRIVKGTAVYTANFTPSTTPLTAITNTSLLTCQSNRFVDNSTNNFTITKNGDTSVQRFSPFSPTTAYSTSVIGGSGYFDGSGDYLSVADNAAFNLSGGDYTIEAWIYWDGNTSDYRAIIAKRVDGTGTTAWEIFLNISTGTFCFFDGTIRNSGVKPNPNAWSHVAACWNNSTSQINLYLNGARVLQTSATNTNQSANVVIGRIYASGGEQYIGYMTDVRVVKGTQVYTGTTYTVPTAPLTAISGTSLLLSTTNAGILDNAMMNDLETVGNAQISTSVKKYGTGSMYFDGSGDYLVAPNAQNLFSFGTGDFTIECWVYYNSIGADQGIIDCRAPGDGLANWILNVQSGGVVDFIYGATRLRTAGLFSTGSWVHIAVTRASGTIRIFVNGTNSASATYTSAIDSRATVPNIGRAIDPAYMNGYIDDLRITKGVARYTANFTPPTSQVQDQ